VAEAVDVPLLRMMIELYIRAASFERAADGFQQITVVIPGAGGFIFSMLLTLSAAILPLFYIKRRGVAALRGKTWKPSRTLFTAGATV
jgi:hypothetical protein